jgi:peptidoglycan/xylan/chitin deacetylase (PgdA/CDA1 family)
VSGNWPGNPLKDNPVLSSFKSFVRHVMAGIYYYSGLYKEVHRGKATILVYHRVLPEKEMDGMYVQPGMYVRQDVFEKQMRFLKEQFRLVSLAELLGLWERKRYDQSQRYCVITFDDGWLDNYIYAYPILKKHSIPATIFLSTSFIGTRNWFWPDKICFLLDHYLRTHTEEKKRYISLQWAQYPWMKGFEKGPSEERIDLIIERWKTLPEGEIHNFIENTGRVLEVDWPDKRLVLNWKEIEEMSGNGISFGSHSVHHRILTRVGVAEAREEIENSLEMLTGRNINFIPVFCYPNGSYNDEIQEIVKRSGYRAAVNGHSGFERELPEDLFGIKRIGVHNDMSRWLSLFSWHIAGLNHTLSKIKKKVREE